MANEYAFVPLEICQRDALDRTLSTPGGYAYWSTIYTTADKTGVHLIPSGDQIGVAGEAYVPFERVDLRGEVVYVNEGRREAASSTRSVSLRVGHSKAWAAFCRSRTGRSALPA